VNRDWMGRIRDVLTREYDENTQENGYWLNQIARHYVEGIKDVAPVGNLPDLIAALNGDALSQAARTYLNTADYVKVTLMPAR